MLRRCLAFARGSAFATPYRSLVDLSLKRVRHAQADKFFLRAVRGRYSHLAPGHSHDAVERLAIAAEQVTPK